MGFDTSKSVRTYKLPNNEALQEFLFATAPSVTYKDTPAASNDPFSAKTNKYAESPLLRIVSTGAGLHIRFGDSSISDAVVTDVFIPADTVIYYPVDAGKPYMRILQAAATATTYITEVY